MKQIRKTPKCIRCGKRYLVQSLNGLPSMLGFVQKDGRVINMCQKCLMDMGKMSDEEKDAFFESIGIHTVRDDDNLLE